MLLEFCFLAFAIFGALLVYANIRPANYPPGPFTFPVFGHLIHFALNGRNGVNALFFRWLAKYGKVFAVDFGSMPAVIISDMKLIREVFSNNLATGRPRSIATSMRTGGVLRGIIFADGQEWLEQRRFTVRHLRDFGFGKKSMESLVAEEAMDLIDGFRKDAGKPVSTQNRFNLAVLNALWTITAGERFSHDDPKLKEIIESITRLVVASEAPMIHFLPWLAQIFPELSGLNNFKREIPFTYNFLKAFSQERLKNYHGGNPMDFTDVYIEEIKSTVDSTSSFYGSQGEESMIATLQDLFVAGAETTSTTLTYVFLYLSVFPEKQAKLHEELDSVLKGRFPVLADRPKMPYTESVIMETMRFSSMVPHGIFHYTLDDITVDKYRIPKNTIVAANLIAVHNDPEIWGDPENFRPERFIELETTSTGDNKVEATTTPSASVIRHEALMPFSVGKRVCPGETMAKDELFIFISSIFQSFQVTWDPAEPKPSLEQVMAIVSAPLPHKLIFKERH